MEEQHGSGQAPPRQVGGSPFAVGARRLVRAFTWHLGAFVTANAALTVANLWIGGGWWAFWPLVATGLLLAVHYLFARVEELNLKSYDRSHIEDLKARHGDGASRGAEGRKRQGPDDGIGARG
jgi:hypothetical protein